MRERGGIKKDKIKFSAKIYELTRNRAEIGKEEISREKRKRKKKS